MGRGVSKRVTREDVARAAGVSCATVSYAINKRQNSGVPDVTCERVLAAAQQLGYKPNPHARALSGGRTQSIGLLMCMNPTPSALCVLRGITDRVSGEGYATYIGDHRALLSALESNLEEFSDRHVDGVIIQLERAMLSNKVLSLLSKFPAVAAITSERLDIPFDQVVQARTNAVRETVDHFASSGRTKICYFVDNITRVNDSKIKAFTQQLEKHGLPAGEDTLLTMDHRFDTDCHLFYECLEKHFPSGRPDMDAVLCMCDEAAIVMMKWLNSRGARVPEDVAVAGFNNLTVGSYLSVPLASTDRREGEMIESVLSMLFARLENPGAPAHIKEIPMKFVLRESAG